MSDTGQPAKSQLKHLWKLIFSLVSSDTLSVLISGIQLLRRTFLEQATGLYEVLDFRHTLEILDAKGKKAVSHKRNTVRLLQDYVAAYVEEAWGIGEAFADFKCSPGEPVDRFPCGHRECVLISFREIKRRGEVFSINIDRTIRDGFGINPGWIEATVKHRTRDFEVAVIFPAERKAEQVSLLEVNANRTTPLGVKHIENLPDGRQKVFWRTKKPRLFETYTLKWTW